MTNKVMTYKAMTHEMTHHTKALATTIAETTMKNSNTYEPCLRTESMERGGMAGVFKAFFHEG